LIFVTCFWFIRILLGKLPDGIYKISKDSILVAELPCVYSRTSWKGPSPRDLLCSFCRLQRLSEPHFTVNRVSESCNVLGSATCSEEAGSPKTATDNQYTNDGRIDKESPDVFKCYVKIYSKKRELLLEYSTDDNWSKESDALQNSALKVLMCFNHYFKQLSMHVEKLYLPKSTDGFTVYPNIFLQEFAMCLSVYGKISGSDSSTCSTVGLFSMDTSHQQLENSAFLTDIDGQDSGVFPSHGSLTCISYSVHLFMKDKQKRYILEANNEFEFEIGAGAVRNQLESCVTQLSVDQSACFVDELTDRDLILAAASELSPDLSKISRGELLISVAQSDSFL
jgi:hypothetical protein